MRLCSAARSRRAPSEPGCSRRTSSSKRARRGRPRAGPRRSIASGRRRSRFCFPAHSIRDRHRMTPSTTSEVLEFHGMPAIRWRSRDGASAIATHQGAQLVSWTPPGSEECLYVSERSPFEAGRPIRGGIPIAFPQFADLGPLAQHGFARTQAWSFTGASESEEGSRVSFALESSRETEALWTGAFRLVLTATLGGPRLDVQLHVANTGHDAFAFAAALHT